MNKFWPLKKWHEKAASVKALKKKCLRVKWKSGSGVYALTPVQLFIKANKANIETADHIAAAFRNLDILSYSECGMVVSTRLAGLSISEAVDLLGFPHKTKSRFYKQELLWSKMSCWCQRLEENGQIASSW